MDSDDEAYILLLLSDGNLPTGSFVASAGLESYATHGFLLHSGSAQKDRLADVVDFVRDNTQSYSQSALAFVSDAHQLVYSMVHRARPPEPATSESPLSEDILSRLMALDELYETMTLNHVARRASRAQGVALLSLYSKGFAGPATFRNSSWTSGQSGAAAETEALAHEDTLVQLVDKLKLAVRREDTPGHLPICWGILTAALGLSLERSQFLHLFLYARGLLSVAVRMNTIGPYAAQQLLLHAIRPIVNAETKRCGHLRTSLQLTDTVDHEGSKAYKVQMENGPAMTWPLGEILAARHDLQHSRIFNS